MTQQDDPIGALVERFPRLLHGKHPRVMSHLPAGWTGLVTRLFQDIDAMLDDARAEEFEVIQIKEKFGGLRVYWRLGGEETAVIDIFNPQGTQRLNLGPKQPTSTFERISARVDEAEAEAAQTCQRCGKGGAATGGSGWHVTLCRACVKAGKEGAP